MVQLLQMMILKGVAGMRRGLQQKNANLEIHPAEPAGCGKRGVPGMNCTFTH
jgi:hypothetical protein